MTKEYDLIFIGAGLSSLMFLNRYLKKFKNHTVLILERKKEIEKDQTFCVWEGPGLDSIQNNFNLKPKKIWDKIHVQNSHEKVIRDINPYKYVCFDGHNTLKKLMNEHADQVNIKNDVEVKNIEKKDHIFIVKSKDKFFKGKFVVDSRHDFAKKNIKSCYVNQAFVGHEIQTNKNEFTPDQVTLMSFSNKSKEIEFTYILPFSARRALVETTVFSKKPNMTSIKNTQKNLLKTFEIKNIIRTEQGVIPMAIIKNNSYKDEILKIGTSVGMVRPSSGYSMRRIASWLLGIKMVKLNNKSYKSYYYKHNRIINWLDSIFLKVIYYYPNKGSDLFLCLFRKANMPSLIRFLSDHTSTIDLIKILWAMPKKLMIKGLFK